VVLGDGATLELDPSSKLVAVGDGIDEGAGGDTAMFVGSAGGFIPTRAEMPIARAKIAKPPPIPIKKNFLGKVETEGGLVPESMGLDDEFVWFVGCTAGVCEYRVGTTLGVKGTPFILLVVADCVGSLLASASNWKVLSGLRAICSSIGATSSSLSPKNSRR
jgi:hypothetical protein